MTNEVTTQNHLLKKLKEAGYHDRSFAAEKLADFKSDIVVEALITALDDKYFEVQEEAVAALGNIGNQKAAPYIMRFLKDDSSQRLQYLAAEALAKLKYKPAISELKNMLKDKNWLHRESAAEGLYFFKNKSTALVLIEALKDKHSRVVAQAAAALGNMRSSLAVKPLVKMLQHEDFFVRESCVEALYLIGDTSVIPDLEKLANDDSDLVRAQVQKGLKLLSLKSN